MFVSRARFNAMERRALDAENSRDTAWQLVSTAQKMWADLFDKYHALRVQGANEPAPAAKPLERTKTSAVDEVIGSVAGSNSRLRKQLKDYVVQQRFAGSDDKEIAHALLNWDEDDAGMPE